MAERDSSDADLALVLQQLRLQLPSAASGANAAQAQLEVLLGRVASLTHALRSEPLHDGARAASRLLLADLAMITAQYRGTVTSIGDRLTRALDAANAVLKDPPETSPASGESR